MEWSSPGTKEGGGAVKVPESRARMQRAEPGFFESCPDGEGVVSAGSELTLSRPWVLGAVGRAGETGWSIPEVCRPPSPALAACVSLLSSRSLWVSVFVFVRGGPLPLVSMNTGSRGGLFLPPGESGGESGPRAGGRRPRNRCECGGGAARGEGRPLGRREGKFRGTGGELCVGEELCLPLTCLCELREAEADSVGTGAGF